MKIGFFEEEENVKSMTRLKSFLILCFLFLFDGYYLYDKHEISLLFIGFNLVILISAFYPQYLKQLVEVGANWKGVNIGEKKDG